MLLGRLVFNDCGILLKKQLSLFRENGFPNGSGEIQKSTEEAQRPLNKNISFSKAPEKLDI